MFVCLSVFAHSASTILIHCGCPKHALHDSSYCPVYMCMCHLEVSALFVQARGCMYACTVEVFLIKHVHVLRHLVRIAQGLNVHSTCKMWERQNLTLSTAYELQGVEG